MVSGKAGHVGIDVARVWASDSRSRVEGAGGGEDGEVGNRVVWRFL